MRRAQRARPTHWPLPLGSATGKPRFAYVRYHEKLFLFAEAYVLNQAWLDRHPDDLAVWPNYIESHLTTGSLAEVSALLAKVFTKLSPAQQVPLLAIEVVALVVQGKPAEAASKHKALRTLRFSEGIPLLYKELPR